MPTVLVSPQAMQDFLGIGAGTDAEVLQQLIAATQAAFEREAGRTRVPFQDAATGRTEVHAGTGSTLLVLDYPIAALTSVKLGFNASAPDETLSVSDPTVLVFGLGERTLERVDGGLFGEYGRPRSVHVTYNTQADLPTDVALAIKRVVAQLYRQRGSEDATQESVDGYARTLADLTAKDSVWARTVLQHQRVTFL